MCVCVLYRGRLARVTVCVWACRSVEEIVRRYGDLGGELHMVKMAVDRSSSSSSGTGLGLDLAGNAQLDTMSVFVAGIHPDSPAARDGRIHVGDQLLQVYARHPAGCQLHVLSQ